MSHFTCASNKLTVRLDFLWNSNRVQPVWPVGVCSCLSARPFSTALFECMVKSRKTPGCYTLYFRMIESTIFRGALGSLFSLCDYGLFEDRLISEHTVEVKMIRTLNWHIWEGSFVELPIKINIFLTTAGATCSTGNLQEMAPLSLDPNSMKLICSELENKLRVVIVH